MNWIKSILCKHDIEFVDVEEWVCPHWAADKSYLETRKYMVCKKCGWKKRIAKH